jgi:tetratricopeptide (TPR) repeat protein
MSESIDNLLSGAIRARLEMRFSDAKRDLLKAAEVSRKMNDQRRLARALASLGQIERDLNNNDDALRLYEESLEIYRTLNSPLKLAHAVRHVGDILRHMERFAAAGISYTEALSIYRAHPETPPLELANALRGFALLKEAAGEKAEAKAMWEEAGSLYAAANVETGVAESARKAKLLGK